MDLVGFQNRRVPFGRTLEEDESDALGCIVARRKWDHAREDCGNNVNLMLVRDAPLAAFFKEQLMRGPSRSRGRL